MSSHTAPQKDIFPYQLIAKWEEMFDPRTFQRVNVVDIDITTFQKGDDFHGLYRRFDESGSIVADGLCNEGKRIGVWLENGERLLYDENGEAHLLTEDTDPAHINEIWDTVLPVIQNVLKEIRPVVHAMDTFNKNLLLENNPYTDILTGPSFPQPGF